MVRLVVSILSVAFSVLGVAGAKDPGGPKGSGYNQVRRPQVHFSPPKNFMNDPNGLFYHNGTYHMYYQWDATANVAGNQHWGHATSPDLYHWQNHPPAIAPGAPGEGILVEVLLLMSIIPLASLAASQLEILELLPYTPSTHQLQKLRTLPTQQTAVTLLPSTLAIQ